MPPAPLLPRVCGAAQAPPNSAMAALRLRGSLVLAMPWLATYLADAVVRRSWFGAAYVTLLERSNVSVNAGQVQWYTTRINGVVECLGQRCPRANAVWFAAGAVVGVLALFASVATLTYTVLSQLLYAPGQPVLAAVIPGVKLPTTEAGYWFFALAVAGIVHEVGHAIAAVGECVQVCGFGVFIVGVYPGAFVDLNGDQLAALSPVRQLRIYCAGVWHNFMLSLVCLTLLAAMPVLVWPLYASTAAGATVQYIMPGSAVVGSIATGALVTGINECSVASAATWTTLRQDMGTNPGFCTPASYIAEVAQSVYLCCDDGLEAVTLPEEVARTAVCFVHEWQAYGNTDRVMDNDPLDSDAVVNYTPGARRLCLPAHQVVAGAPCEDDTDCVGADGNDENNVSDRLCLRPAASDLAERLIRIRVEGQPTVLYVGHPINLLSTVAVQDSRPRLPVMPVYLPLVLERLLQYTYSLSSALCLLNMVPAYHLDGHWATIAIIELLVPAWTGQRKAAVARAILAAGSALFIVAVLVSLWSAFSQA